MTLAERRELQRIARAKQENTPVNNSDKIISLKINDTAPVTVQPVSAQTRADAILNKKRELQAAQEEKELVLKDAASSPGSTLLKEQAARKSTIIPIANQQQYDKDFMSNYKAPSKVLPSIPAPYVAPKAAPVNAPVNTAPTIKLAAADVYRNADKAKAEVTSMLNLKSKNTPPVGGKVSAAIATGINKDIENDKDIEKVSKDVVSGESELNKLKNKKRELEVAAQKSSRGTSTLDIAKLNVAIEKAEKEINGKKDQVYYYNQGKEVKSLETVKNASDYDKTVSLMNPAAIEVKPFDKYHLVKQQSKRALDPAYGAASRASSSELTDLGYGNVDHMTDEQKKVLSYYVGKNDWESADKYIKGLEVTLNASKEEANYAKVAEREASGALGKTANVALNVLGSLVSPAAYLDLFGKTVKEGITGKYEPIDLNSSAYAGVNLSANTSKELSASAYNAVYKNTGSAFWADITSNGVGIGLSVLQNAARLPVAMLSQPASLLLMAGGAAGSTGAEAIKSGGTKGQALTLATSAGIVEYITEKISLDNMFDLIEKSGKKVAKNVVQTAFQKYLAKVTKTTGYKLVKTFAVETTEEIAAEYANNIVDQLVMGDKSQYEQYVKYLVNNSGYSDADARKAATNQFYGKNILWAGIGGFASGGIMGGTGMIIGNAIDNAKRAEAARIVAQAHGVKEAQKTTPTAPTEPVPVTGTPVTTPSVPTTAAQPIPAAPTPRTPADITPVLTNMRDAYSAGDTEVGDLMYEAAVKTLKEESDDIRNDKTIPVDEKKQLIDGYKKQLDDLTAERDESSVKKVAEPEAIPETKQSEKVADAAPTAELKELEQAVNLEAKPQQDVIKRASEDTARNLIEKINSAISDESEGKHMGGDEHLSLMQEIDSVVSEINTSKMSKEEKKQLSDEIINASNSFNAERNIQKSKYEKEHGIEHPIAAFEAMEKANSVKKDADDAAKEISKMKSENNPEGARAWHERIQNRILDVMETVRNSGMDTESKKAVIDSLIDKSNLLYDANNKQSEGSAPDTGAAPAETAAPEPTPEAKKITVPESVTVVKDGNRFIVKNKVTLPDNTFKRFRRTMEEAGGKYDSTVRAFVFDKNPMDLFEADSNVEDRTSDNWKPTINGKITIDEAPVTVYNSDIDGKSVFVIKASKYVGKEKFGTLRGKMESIGGVYDSKIQGFTFTTDPSEYLEASDTVTNNIGKAETVTKTAETVSKPEEIVSKAQETVAKEPEAKQPETEKAPVKAVENTPVEAKSEEAKPEPVKPPAETKDATAAEPKEDNPVTKSGKPTSKALSATGVDSKLVTLYAKNKKDVYNFARDGKEYVINDIILLRANPETISKISEERKRKGFTAIKKNDAIIEGFFKTIEKSSTSIKPEDATLDTLTLYGKTTELVKISAGTKNIYYDPDYLKYLALRADEISVDTKPEKVNIIMARDSEGTVGFMLPVRTPPADTVTAKTAPYDVGWFNQSKTVKPKTEEVTNVKATDTERNVLEGQSAPDDGGIQEKAGKQETVKETGADKVSQQIANYVVERFKAADRKPITRTEINNIAKAAYGGTLASGELSIKDVNDAMELGMNQYILQMDKTTREYSAIGMMELMGLLPTQNNRTDEQVKYQQFSTPPSIAFVASYAANINENDTMLEPSAGIGGIAVFAKNNGAKVIVNELDPRRLGIIKNLPFDKFYSENAEQLDNILGDKIKPTVVVMNPPFSSSASRNTKEHTVGAKHVEEALKVLQDGGRLVAVVGQGMNSDAASFREWWTDIKSKYNVRANIGLDGKNYTKYGTSFGIQILVIDKNGPTTGEVMTGQVDTIQKLQEKLEGIRNDRAVSNKSDKGSGEVQPPAVKSESTGTTGQEAGNADTGNTVSDATPNTSAGEPNSNTASPGSRRPGGRDSVKADGQSNVSAAGRTGEQGGSGGSNTGTPKSENSGRNGGKTDKPSATGDIQPTVKTEKPEMAAKDNKKKNASVKKTELTDSMFDTYVPQKLNIKGAKPHPSPVAESSAMAAIESPEITYVPMVPQSLIDNGDISEVQLEFMCYAGQAHAQTLQNGYTRGIFLGDGTGVGKGRTIAGMILDRFNRGDKKAVWISKGSDLISDAKRDVIAIHGNDKNVSRYEGGAKAENVLKIESGILFTTYKTIATGYTEEKSNIKTLIEWLGKDYDGLIVFDESHMMANAVATKGKRGTKGASDMAKAGLMLQAALPKAKIVYSSATGATEVSNLQYAERLGLWGQGTSFTSGSDFVGKIASGGIAAMEVVSRSMKALGVYVSRNLSYDGVTYDRLTHNLTERQKFDYNKIADAWEVVCTNIEKALGVTNASLNGYAKGKVHSALWGAQQRFFNQIITSMQVPTMISDIEKKLAQGKSIVIQLTSTNKAHQDREIAKLEANKQDLDEYDATPKASLIDFLLKSFPVQEYETVVDDKGNVSSVPVVDSEGKPVENRAAVAARDALITEVNMLQYPDSPLDMIINHFGADNVAENSGRTSRIITGEEGRKIQQKLPGNKDAEVQAFQDGKKRIIIFSEAGGTGKSYHADKNAKNQQQRVHYLLQAGWRADVAVQGFGRSHRSNQAVPPEFILLNTDISGQKRFISTIAKRLDQLGALTKGQSDTGSQGIFNATDNLEGPLAEYVLENTYLSLIRNDPDALKRMGFTGWFNKDGTITPDINDLRDIGKFLNRIFMLRFDEQNDLFNIFDTSLQQAIYRAKENGTYMQGLENYKADRVHVDNKQDIRADESSGAATQYYKLTAYNKLIPVQFEELPTKDNKFVGFYQNNRSGSIRAMFETVDTTDKYGNVTKQYRLLGQRNRLETIPRDTIQSNWTKVEDKAEAKLLWENAVSELPKETETTVHVIGGEILSIWDRLPSENVRIRRFLLDDGVQLIGRTIQDSKIDEILRRVGIDQSPDAITAAKVLSAINSGDTVKLMNGFKLFRSRVANEYRIEIDGIPSFNIDYYARTYNFITETISYKKRVFIPVNDRAEEAIEKLLKSFPAERILDANTSTSYSATPDTLRTDDRYFSDLVANLATPRGINVVIDDDIDGDGEVMHSADEADTDNYTDAELEEVLQMLTRSLGVYNLVNGTTSKVKEQPITVKQKREVIRKSTAQKEYFASSKVRNKSGTLIPVYHNTNADFTVFDISRSGSNQGSTKGKGIYLSTSKDAYNDAAYGTRQMKLFANITNPYTVGKGFTKQVAEHLIEKYDNTQSETHYSHLMSKLTADSFGPMDYIKYFAEKNSVSTIDILTGIGYDGIRDGVEWVAFKPEQVKLVSNKKPTINLDIRYSADKAISAYYDPTLKQIHISKTAAKSNTILLGHELFHSLSEADQARLVMFFRQNSDTTTEAWKKFKADRTATYTKLYAKTGRTFTEKDFWQEYAAENCETLFTDETYIKRLAGKSKSLAQKILDFIRDMWHRFIMHDTFKYSRASTDSGITYDTLIKAEKMYADALGVKSHNLKAPKAAQADVSDNYGYGETAEEGVSYSATDTAEAEDRSAEELADLYKGDHMPLATHTAIEMIKGSTEWSWQRISRTIPDVPESGDNGTFFAMFRNAIIRFRSAAPRASAEAGRLMDSMVSIKGADGKTTPLSPEDFETFQKAVYYYDLREEAKIQRMAEPDKAPILPHNMTESEVQKQIDRLDINKNVTAALNKRSATWNGIVSKYITYNKDVGWDVSGRFTRENYYHHQVIDFMDQSKNKNIRFNRRNGTVEINTGRGWVRHRAGSERATNTNFITVEYLVLQQMLYDTEVAKMLSDTKQRYDIKPQLVTQAKNMNKASVDSIIIGEAKGAAVRAAETSLSRKLTADEIENIEPEYTTRGIKQIPTSPTYDALNVFNKRMAMSADMLHRMALKDEFEDVPAQFRNAVENLKQDQLGPEVFAFMSYLASSVEVEEQAKISALTFLSNVAKKERFIRNLLGKDYETWETLLDKMEGFSKIQPRSGQFQYTKEVVAEDKVGKMFNDAVTEIVKGNKFISDEAKDAIIAQYTEQIKVMGMPYETWVVPDVIKIVLGKEAAKKSPNPVANFSRAMLAAWKGWVTSINPLRTVKYAIRNFVGDLDAVVTGNPGIVTHIPKAFTDIYNAMYKNERTADFAEWAELGGMMNLIHVQEIDAGNVKKVFKIITDKPANAWDVIKGIPSGYKNGVQNLQEFREAILRYSAYLFYKEKVNSRGGITDYVASNRNIVRGLDTKQLQAYQLSKDLLGAYDEVSAMGQTIRRHLIPFYSFLETNLKRYYRLYANPVVNIAEEIGSNDSASEKIKGISGNAGKLVYRIAAANALMALMMLVNRVLNPDDDDKLPEDVRARPHFTFGHIGDNIITFTRLGNISEMLEWVGLDDLQWDAEDIYAPADKIYGSITPFLKTPFELSTGLTFYPEFAHPRAIRDRWQYFFNTLGSADVYSAVSGKPSNKNFLDVLKSTVIYSYDYKTAAYWDIMGAKAEYQDKADMTTMNPTRKQNALYYMKQAIRYGEQDKAEKYLDEYFEEGGNGRGIATSIAMMNPLYGFLSEETVEKGKVFVKSLDDVMTEKLYVAYDYYEKYLEIPPEFATWLRKDSTTEEQAKAMLKTYIKKVTALANKK